MTSIVERLRKERRFVPPYLAHEAAEEIERLRASELAWKLIAEKNDQWNALPQSEKEAALRKALTDAVAESETRLDEIERLRARVYTLEHRVAGESL